MRLKPSRQGLLKEYTDDDGGVCSSEAVLSKKVSAGVSQGVRSTDVRCVEGGVTIAANPPSLYRHPPQPSPPGLGTHHQCRRCPCPVGEGAIVLPL